MTRPTVTLDDPTGVPVKIQIAIRESTTMPSRIKVHFRTDEEKPQATDFDGDVHRVQTGPDGEICPEFRLEMN